MVRKKLCEENFTEGCESNGRMQDVVGCHDEASMRLPEDLHRSPTNVHRVPIWRKPRWMQALLPASVNHGHHLFSRSKLGLLVWGDRLTRCNCLPRACPQPHEDVFCHTTGSVLPDCQVLLQACASGLQPWPRQLLRCAPFGTAPHVDENGWCTRTTRTNRDCDITNRI